MSGFATTTRIATNGMICTVDHLASSAGIAQLASGGNAADAAIAASAVLAVTNQQMCGMGGDLWALVHTPPSNDANVQAQRVPLALNASGRAGSGADPAALRDEGRLTMPFRGDIRSVPIPGCVDGWLELHDRCGRAPLADVLAPAIDLAQSGFPVGPFLARSLPLVADVDGATDYLPGGSPAVLGQIVRRPGIARSLEAIVENGRSGWYEGEFGDGLLKIGAGLYSADDLKHSQADWVEPVHAQAWGHHLWTTPPNSQGYLNLAGAVIAGGLPLPSDPDDPQWAHLLIEAAKQAAFDRGPSLHEHADGASLVSESRLGPRRAAIRTDAVSKLTPPAAAGGTIYLCTTDADGMGVSLIQSNAAGFGAHLAVPEVGVFLQNRGVGFSLEPGHPAEFGPRRRPPSTLAPALITNPDQTLRSVLGTMGGDSQPQVVLQMIASLLASGRSPGEIIDQPRFAITAPKPSGFNTWEAPDEVVVALEDGHPWGDALASLGHQIHRRERGDSLFGHAHLIERQTTPDGTPTYHGASEPRADIGAAIGR